LELIGHNISYIIDTLVWALSRAYSEIPAIFYSFVAAIISAVMASRLIAGNNKRDRSFMMIQEYFSGRLHLARRRSDKFIRTNFPEIKNKKEKWEIIRQKLEENDQDEREFYHVMQYFERLFVLLRAKAIDSNLIWLSLGRHIIYWNDEVFSNIIPEQSEIDPRQGRLIVICKELDSFISHRESRLLVRIKWEAKHPWIPGARKSVWQRLRGLLPSRQQTGGSD
jgi:hypothetical protein